MYMRGLAFTLGLSLAATGLAASAHAQLIAYPPTERGTVVEEKFGEHVADPYRWLEGDVRTDAKVRAWVDAQAAVTETYLAALPGRAAITRRLTKLWNYERESVPVKRGGRYFYTHNSGLQNQAPLYVRDGLSGTPRLLIDPNPWASDGATALAEWFPSSDGKKLTYAVQDGGSDWRTLHVVDVATGKLLADAIPWVIVADPVWAKDGSGFFYSRSPELKAGEAYRDQRVYFHRLGTPVSDDRLVFETPRNPNWLHYLSGSDDGRWLVIQSALGILKYEVTLVDMTRPDARPLTLVAGAEHDWQFAGGSGNMLYFVTDKGAERRRIVAFDLAGPQPAMREIVAQDRMPLQNAKIVGGRLFAHYLVDAKSEARLFALDGKPLGTVKLPGVGTIAEIRGGAQDPEALFSFVSFNHPENTYRLDMQSGGIKPLFKPKLAFDPDDYVVEQRFYPSKDGTKVPLFLTYRKGLDLKKGAPVLLYGYGGFSIVRSPEFRVENFGWMDAGGIYAQAAIRGGGEYGEAWHAAGMREKKQNVFDDFAAAGEYMIAAGITTRDQLAIRGGSNGGLLIGAVVNQRPDLFAAAITRVAVLDTLRFDQFTAGQYWTDEYGRPDRETDWRILRAYSPYHNIRPGTHYPAILAVTADTDDRVVPAHTFKYVAALQHADLGPKPQLARIETRAGHGAGKPTDKAIAAAADELVFAAKWTGLKIAEGE